MKVMTKKIDVLSWAVINPSKRGSFEDYICVLAKECGKRGISIRFVFGDKIAQEPKKQFELDGVDYDAVDVEKLFSVNTLADILCKYSPDVIHFNFIGPGSLLIPVSHIYGIKKVIFSDHSSSPVLTQKPKNYIFTFPRLIKRKIFCMLVNRFIAVSNFVADRLEVENNIPKNKITVLYNGIDLERFSGIQQDERNRLRRSFLGQGAEKLIITTVAQLISEKGIRVLLEGARIALNTYHDLLFIIAGEGADRDFLENNVKKWGAESNIKFIGFTENVKNLLAASDIFVLPSLWGEACSMALIEAIAAGLPVITTNVGGNPEIIQDGTTGLIVSPNNSKELAFALERLIIDNNLRASFGRAAYERAKKYFDIYKMVSETVSIYKKMLDNA